jgi:aminoglycoside phosphotransferase family enzyme/predicted kinase
LIAVRPMEQSLDDPMVQDLLRPQNLPGRPSRIEFTFTHGSLVFLTERDVYKIKRAKDYGFFDYTTLEARKHYCEEEVRLNRRTAPDVYLGVLPVFRDEDGHSLSRPADVVDYAVHMRRLPDDRSALSLLKAGQLGPDEVRALARFVARFYRQAEVRSPIPGALRTSIEENFEQVAPFAGKFADKEVLQQIQGLQEAWLVEHDELLKSRPSRDGHGDLRLEHGYLLDDGPLIIDCIEFLDRFRVGDPALDVAFLAMDLYGHGRAGLAEVFLGVFAYENDDYDFYPLVDGYMSYRAMVRAKLACFVASDPSTPQQRAARKVREARELFTLAHRFVAHPRHSGRVIGVGGIIASGKTAVAEALAPLVEGPVVSADATRKYLAGIDKEELGDQSIYTTAFTHRVHEELLRRASQVLQGGRPVILDTTFKSRQLRGRARRLAERMKVPFVMIECGVPETVARERLRGRNLGVSDAREDLLDNFLRDYEPMAELAPGELVLLDTTRSEGEILDELSRREVIDTRPGGEKP